MLKRYQKPGGMIQLLQLLESCSLTKREHLLGIVLKEDPVWAVKIRPMILTFEKILSWPEGVVGDVVKGITIKVMGAALIGLKPAHIKKAMGFFTRVQQIEIEMFMSMKISAGETESARNKIIEKVRKMEDEMQIDLTHFAPECCIKNIKVA